MVFKLVALALLAGYGWGVWSFLKGFRRTNYSQGKLRLALCWPVLFMANGSFRTNFQKALRGN